MKKSLTNSLMKFQGVQKALMRQSAVSFLAIAFSLVAAAQESTTSPNNAPATNSSPRPIMAAPGLNRATLQLGSQGVEVSELQAALRLLGYYNGTVDGFYSESTAVAVSLFQQAAGLSADGIVGPATWNRLFPAIASTSASAAPTTPTSPPDTASLAFPTPSAARTPDTSANRETPTAQPTPVLTATPAPTPPATATTSSPSTARSQSAASQPTSVELPVLRTGMRGSAVIQLQERLQSLGFLKGSADGVFGPATETAVKSAQRQYGLDIDGIVGSATWRALLR